MALLVEARIAATWPIVDKKPQSRMVWPSCQVYEVEKHGADAVRGDRWKWVIQSKECELGTCSLLNM